MQRSETDDDLAVCVFSRRRARANTCCSLFANASESVRARLKAADRAKADVFRDMVAKAAEQFQAEARQHSAEYAAAEPHVARPAQWRANSRDHLSEFARAGKFDETTIALSIMCNLPIGLVERAFTQSLQSRSWCSPRRLGCPGIRRRRSCGCRRRQKSRAQGMR